MEQRFELEIPPHSEVIIPTRAFMPASPNREWWYPHALSAKADAPFDGAVVQAHHTDGWRVFSKWATIRGRAEPVEVTLRPPAGRSVTTDAIRRLPVGAVLAQSRMELVISAKLVKSFVEVDPGFVRPGPHKGRRLEADELQQVADVYRAAHAEGRPVNEAIREAFDLTKDGAAKRIMAARKAGLLDGVGPKR